MKRRAPKIQYARLPNGQRVIIESHEGDIATVRRIDGPGYGTLAVCPINKLKPLKLRQEQLQP
jgi:nitrite reductase/ring-hydroxylating ferredoxin subunit